VGSASQWSGAPCAERYKPSARNVERRTYDDEFQRACWPNVRSSREPSCTGSSVATRD